MKKPINKFAVALWVLAAIYVIAQVWLWVYLSQVDNELAKLGQPPRWPALLNSPVLAGLIAAHLAAFGMLIEIADKIRWLIERKAG